MSRPTPPDHPLQRVLLIANPVSGGGRAAKRAHACAAALAKLGVHGEVYLTTAAGDGAARARRAGDEAWDALVACGGDGTVNEVLGGMPDLNRPLAMLPVGTANVLAIELGLPRNPAAVAAMIAGGRTRRLAVGTVNGRRFLLFCGVGLDGAVVNRLAEVRTGTLGKRKWLGPILHITRHWPRYSLRATFADGSVRDDLSTVLVTRVRDYGGVVKLPAGIDIDDSRLFAVCFRARSRMAWIWLGLRGLFRAMRQGRSLEVVPTEGLTITGAAPYQVDGDGGGTTPLTIGMADERVPFVVP